MPNDGLRPLPPGCKQLLNSRTAAARPQPWNAYRGLDVTLDMFRGIDSWDPIEPRRPTLTSSWPASRARSRTAIGRGKPTSRPARPNITDAVRQPAVAAALPVPRRSAELGRRHVHPRPKLRRSPAAPACRCSPTADPDRGLRRGHRVEDAAHLGSDSQNIVEANLQGKIADMRNGELRFATGVAKRENKFSYDPGDDQRQRRRSSSSRSASSCRTTRPARRTSRSSTASC